MSEFVEAAENVATKASETNSTNVDGLEDKSKETKVNEKGDGTPNPNDIPDAPNVQDSYDSYDTTGDNSEADAPSEDDIKDETKKQNEGLSDAEQQQIKDETGWSDEIVNHIDSMEQYEIYKNAGLHEEVVNGRPCLVKDIDWDYIDPKTGKTNRELAAEGRSPIDSKTGEKIELHHMGQDQNGPFVELSESSEHGDGNHGTLHPNDGESWRHKVGAKSQYNQERAEHWKSRAEGGN
ncbi:MAG: HNH/ENDO VII family nuclease [Victivallaceae bacterium]|nr:HNH/ENDO VII family nuclease [Victivallaceae bacterium]